MTNMRIITSVAVAAGLALKLASDQRAKAADTSERLVRPGDELKEGTGSASSNLGFDASSGASAGAAEVGKGGGS